jgi:hypothetical protein
VADSPHTVVAREGSPFVAGGRVRVEPGRKVGAPGTLLAGRP